MLLSHIYNYHFYTPCLQKLHIFCSVLVKYEVISIKIGTHVQEETINKTVQKIVYLIQNMC